MFVRSHNLLTVRTFVRRYRGSHGVRGDTEARGRNVDSLVYCKVRQPRPEAKQRLQQGGRGRGADRKLTRGKRHSEQRGRPLISTWSFMTHTRAHRCSSTPGSGGLSMAGPGATSEGVRTHVYYKDKGACIP